MRLPGVSEYPSAQYESTDEIHRLYCRLLAFEEYPVVLDAIVGVYLGVEFARVAVTGKHGAGNNRWRFAVSNAGQGCGTMFDPAFDALLQFAKQCVFRRSHGYGDDCLDIDAFAVSTIDAFDLRRLPVEGGQSVCSDEFDACLQHAPMNECLF